MSDKITKVIERISSEKALHKIGLRLTNKIRIAVTKQKIIDHGLLRMSTRYRVDGNLLTLGIGSYYAKFHEFGTKPSRKMARWLFANVIGKGGNKKKSKNVIQWTGTGKNIQAHIKARPFFWPTINNEQKYITEVLKAFYLGNK